VISVAPTASSSPNQQLLYNYAYYDTKLAKWEPWFQGWYGADSTQEFNFDAGSPLGKSRIAFSAYVKNDCGVSEQSRENAQNNGLSLVEITTARFIDISLINSSATYRADDSVLPEFVIKVTDFSGAASKGIKLKLSLIGAGTFEDATKSKTLVTDAVGEVRVKVKSVVPGTSSIGVTPETLGQFTEAANTVAGKETSGISPGIFYVTKSVVFAISKAAAELIAKQDADAKAAADLKAKQEADEKAKAAAELKAKQEAEAKAAAELKAKQEAEAERQLLESSNEATDAANAAIDAANTAALATDASILAALGSIDELSAQVDLLASEIRVQVNLAREIFNRIKSKVKK
jgi:hypothetical protein